MAKIHEVGEEGEIRPFIWQDTFEIQPTTEHDRIAIGARDDQVSLLRKLMACLPSELQVLYMLKVPRGGTKEGRYESPVVNHAAVESFLNTFGAALEGDGRHELWIGATEGDGLLVYDRHDIVYGYGPLDRFREIVTAAGFTESKVDVDVWHRHYYNAEFDDDTIRLLGHWDWRVCPLEPEDL
ncbi:MAG: hypothetical protein V3T86_01620 [Planctomycetota bacterium]